MKMKIAALALLASLSAAHAQTAGFYTLKDATSPQNTLLMLIYSNSNGKSAPASVSVDIYGNALSGAAGTSNTNGTALYVQGVTSGVPIETIFAAPQHVICDSGCNGGGGGSSYTVTYGAAIGTLGTPGGFKDVSGNFQSFLGDTTAGQWVNIKGGSIANTVFGATQSGTWNVGITGTPTVTIGNASIAITAASLPLPAGAATQTTLAALLTAVGSPMQATGGSVSLTGSLPAYAATPTFNLGTLGGAATAANQASVIGTVAGGTAATNSQLIGGVYNSTPITVTNAQQAALQIDANGFLKVNVSAGGASGGTSSTFGASFPGTGTAAGMSQGGNMVALTGTSGNLNVQCANCSGSGASALDGVAFTAGSSVFAPGGGIVQTTATSNPVAAGDQGLFQMTANRALFTNLRNSSGVEIGTAAAPVQVSLANTAANGTALLVTGTGGTFPITAAALPLPAGAATQTTLASILTALGSPFQAGGSIGNTSFGATQATAANLNATVVGTGTFAVQLSGATNNINNISGTISLPTGASTLAAQNVTRTPVAAGTATATNSDLIGAQFLTTQPTMTNTQQASLLTSARGELLVSPGVSGFPVTLASTTITGTVAATQSGTWNVGLSAGSNAIGSITNTSFAATQSGAWNVTNISGTISLPTGAATSALQPTNAAQGSTTSGQTGLLMQMAVLSSPPTYTTATTAPATLTTAGALRTDASATTQPVSAASLPLPSGAATSANQATEITSLATIATNSAAPLPAQSNATTNIGAVSGVVNVTPTDCSGTVTTGGTAQSPISASATIHGFTIANVDASAGSGEPLWISFTGTASAANGSYPLAPPAATTFAANGSYTTPVGFGTNHAVSIFAATTGHKFSCTTW